MLKGAGGKAFCAGGDVRALAGSQLEQPQRVAAAIEYFRAEDSLVYKIANYSKPHVAILDGIVMVRRAKRAAPPCRTLA
jgi:enoyl-CoA hydratase/carnithine racemase